MTINLDNASIDLFCPECSHKFKERIGRLKNDPKITCPGCRKTIHIEAEGLRTGLKEVDKSLADLSASIRKLGK